MQHLGQQAGGSNSMLAAMNQDLRRAWSNQQHPTGQSMDGMNPTQDINAVSLFRYYNYTLCGTCMRIVAIASVVYTLVRTQLRKLRQAAFKS